jgi:hypothetical protein
MGGGHHGAHIDQLTASSFSRAACKCSSAICFSIASRSNSSASLGAKLPVFYDSVGKTTFMHSLDRLRPKGLMVSFGQSSGPIGPVDLGILAQKGSLFVTRPTLNTYAAAREDLAAMADLFEARATPAHPRTTRLDHRSPVMLRDFRSNASPSDRRVCAAPLSRALSASSWQRRARSWKYSASATTKSSPRDDAPSPRVGLLRSSIPEETVAGSGWPSVIVGRGLTLLAAAQVAGGNRR